MAINYTNLFADIGKLVKYFNIFATTAQTLPAMVSAIETVFSGNGTLDAIDGLNPADLNSWQTQYAGRRQALADMVKARLLNPTLLADLGSPSADIGTVIPLFVEKMIADSATINASVAGIGSTTSVSGISGNGTILTTALLDRISSPRPGAKSHHNYGDVLSEFVRAETLTFRCVGDSFADGLTEGDELWEITGGIDDGQFGVATAEGSGNAGSVRGIHGQTSSYIQNADFESFSVTDTPDSWTIDAGTVTTHIQQSTGSNAYHGSSGLQFNGDGANASDQISQAFSASQIKAGGRYAVTFRVKASATIAAGTLTVQFQGTGYTAGAAEKIVIAPGSLPTSWTLKNFNVLIPLNIPSDFKLVAKWTGTPTNAKNVWLDDFGMGPVNYVAGIGCNPVRGATPFVRDDRFTIALTNTEGVFQKFFRRVMGYQLPSVDGGGETIADSAAT